MLHVRRMRPLDVAPHCKLGHRSRPRLPGIGNRWSNTRGLEQQPLPNAVPRHDNLARLDSTQDLRRDRDAGDDDIRALRIEPGDLPSLLGRHAREHVQNMLEIGARDVRGMHRARCENSLTSEVDAGEIREGAAGADELRTAPVANWNLCPHPLGDRATKFAYRLRRDALREVFLGQTNRAEGQGPEPLDHPFGRERNLQRSAPDVDDDGASHPHVEVRDGTAEAETCFFVTIQYADLETGDSRDLGEQARGVARFADRAGRDRVDARCAELLRERRHALDGVERGANGCVCELAGFRETGRESRRRLHFIDNLTRAFRRNVGDDLSNRVRPDIDGGDSTMARGNAAPRTTYSNERED